jgi:hypothetical protein
MHALYSPLHKTLKVLKALPTTILAFRISFNKKYMLRAYISFLVIDGDQRSRSVMQGITLGMTGVAMALLVIGLVQFHYEDVEPG